jgi:hypothetical protein
MGVEWQAYWVTGLGIPVTTQQVKAGLGHRNGSGSVYCRVMLLSQHHYLPFLPATGWRAYLTLLVLFQLTLACGTSLVTSSYFLDVSHPEKSICSYKLNEGILASSLWVRNNDSGSIH